MSAALIAGKAEILPAPENEFGAKRFNRNKVIEAMRKAKGKPVSLKQNQAV